jgi:hypothetical protein
MYMHDDLIRYDQFHINVAWKCNIFIFKTLYYAIIL